MHGRHISETGDRVRVDACYRATVVLGAYTSTGLAALCLLGSAVVSGCGGDMAKTSARDGTGATGRVLSPAADASSSTGGAGSTDGTSVADAQGTAGSPASGTAGSSGGGGGGSGGGGSPDGGGPSDGGDAGVALDPCRACEAARCKIAQPLLATPSVQGAYDAYSVCFSSNPLPGNPTFCKPFDPNITTAAQGPAMGTPKAELCQAALTCARSSPRMCATGGDLGRCYCGTLSDAECIGGQKIPDGDCKSPLEDAAETTDPISVGGVAGNPCGAYGAAQDVIEYCDLRCCPAECHLAQAAGSFDSRWCVAPGASGAAGSGGAGSSGGGGVGGASGSSGGDAGGTGGVIPYGGSAGTSVAVATGGAGTPGAPGATDRAGTTGAAGATGDAGTTGAGGTTGAAGATGGAGASGAAGVSAGPVLSSLADNFRFLTSADDWTATGSNAVATFSTDDADGVGMTGSLHLAQTLGDTSLTTAVAAVQCLPATAGTTFDLDVSVKVPDQTTSRGYIEVVAYPSDFCWGPVHGVYISQQVSAPVWQHVKLSAPLQSTGVQSISVQLVTVKLQGHTSAAALFDNVLVSER